MDFSKYTVEEMQRISSMQRKNLNELFDKLRNSNDSEKIKIADSLSNADLELKYDIVILNDEARKYRFDTLDRFMEMCYDSGLVNIDLVIWSHYRAIVDRLETFLQSDCVGCDINDV